MTVVLQALADASRKPQANQRSAANEGICLLGCAFFVWVRLYTFSNTRPCELTTELRLAKRAWLNEALM
jgi:hypothetical protein